MLPNVLKYIKLLPKGCKKKPVQFPPIAKVYADYSYLFQHYIYRTIGRLFFYVSFVFPPCSADYIYIYNSPLIESADYA